MSIKVSSVSKSRLNDYEKCPLMAWKKLRDHKNRFDDSNKQLQKGILAHEIAAKKVAEIMGEERDIYEVASRFDLEVVYEVEELMENVPWGRWYNKVVPIGVEKLFSMDIALGESVITFQGYYDAVGIVSIDEQQYVVIDEFKSGAIKKSVDLEALLYAYAAYKEYNLPVLFRRMSLSFKNTFEHIFSEERLQTIEPVIQHKMYYWKEEMESDMEPEYTPGGHCQYCPYLSSCNGSRVVNSLHRKIKAAILHKEKAKRYENEVKEAAKQILSEREDLFEPGSNEAEVIPFLEGKYGVVAKHSESYRFKKATKGKVLAQLLEKVEAGEIPMDIIKPHLDIKVDQEVADIVKNSLDIDYSKSVKTSISFVEEKSESEEE